MSIPSITSSRRLVLVPLLGMALIASGCGSSGQKRQTTEASVVVEKAIGHRSQSSFHATDPRLAVLGVLDRPEVDVPKVALQVGSANVFVHEYAAATSKVVGQLKRGDAVLKSGEADYIVPPVTSKMDDLDGNGNPPVLATWSYVECANGITGWVPTRSLVTPEFLATSSEERLRELKMNRAGASGKGMVEKSKPKLFVGKGFGSEQDLQDPNSEAARQIVAEVVQSPTRYDLLTADFFAPIPSGNAPAAGRPLVDVDPAAEAKAAKVRADMASLAGGKPAGGVGDLLGLAGIQDDNALAVAKAAEVIAILQKPRAPTPAEEQGLGELAISIVIGQSKVLPNDHPASAYVQNLGLRLAALSSNPYPATGYRFVVIDYPEANAIATPGGVIMVSTGMLKFMQDEDELAAVLAHEIAHVEERQAMLSESVDDFAVVSDLSMMGPDLMKDIVGEVLKDANVPAPVLAMAQDIVVKEAADAIRTKLQELGTELWQLSADPGQSDECGADVRGIAIASAAGYDPAAMERILVRIERIKGSYGGANYSETRLQDVSSVRAMLPKTEMAAPSEKSERWSKLQGVLDGNG